MKFKEAGKGEIVYKPRGKKDLQKWFNIVGKLSGKMAVFQLLKRVEPIVEEKRVFSVHLPNKDNWQLQGIIYMTTTPEKRIGYVIPQQPKHSGHYFNSPARIIQQDGRILYENKEEIKKWNHIFENLSSPDDKTLGLLKRFDLILEN